MYSFRNFDLNQQTTRDKTLPVLNYGLVKTLLPGLSCAASIKLSRELVRKPKALVSVCITLRSPLQRTVATEVSTWLRSLANRRMLVWNACKCCCGISRHSTRYAAVS